MTRHRVPYPSVRLDRPEPVQSSCLSITERPQTLDAHLRLLFAQRLAILIQRRRAVTTVVPREDAANEYA